MAKLAVFCVLILTLVAFSKQGAFEELTPERAEEIYECMQIGLCDLEDAEKRKEMSKGLKKCFQIWLPDIYEEVWTQARLKPQNKKLFFKKDTLGENHDEFCAIRDINDKKEVNTIVVQSVGKKIEEYCDEEDGDKEKLDKEKCDRIDTFFKCLDDYTEKYQKEKLCK